MRRSGRCRWRDLLAATAIALIVTDAEASVLHWSIDAPIGPGGGRVTGSFIYDTTSGSFYNVNLASPTTSPSGGLVFDSYIGQSGLSGLYFGQSSADPDSLQTQLHLVDIRPWNLDTPGVLQINTAPDMRFGAEVTCTGRDHCVRRIGNSSSVSNWLAGGVGTLTGTVIPPFVTPWILDAPLVGAGRVTGSFFFNTQTQEISNIALVSPQNSASGGLTFDTYVGSTVGGLYFAQSSADPDSLQVQLLLRDIFRSRLAEPGELAINTSPDESFGAEVTCTGLFNCVNRVDGSTSISNWLTGGQGRLSSEITIAGSPEPPPVSPPPVSPTPIPVPATLPLALSGLALLGLMGWRRRRAA